ncbi:hypothetical protein B566_EDAN001191 [Ephemera danica]|nr:hypothetical protein B566_EDAN001191 [Ephemera danica]
MIIGDILRQTQTFSVTMGVRGHILLLLGFFLALCSAAPTLNFPPEEHDAFLEGDIIISPTTQKTAPRNMVSDKVFLWPNKTVIYEFSNEYHSEEKQWIRKAINALANRTCVRFVELGYRPLGRVAMFLSLPYCIQWGTIQHEFLHVLGFFHEHTRPDRDKYVAVQWENVRRGMESNFLAHSWSEARVDNLPYDYGSVMHYRSTAFSRNNGNPTIIPLQEGVTIGQRERFSDLDLAKLNRLYECEAEYYRGDDYLITEKAEDVTKDNEVPSKRLFRRRRQNYFPYREPELDMQPPPYWSREPRPNDCPCMHREEEHEYRGRRCEHERPLRRRPSVGERRRQQNSERKPRQQQAQHVKLLESSNLTASAEHYEDYDVEENNATQYAMELVPTIKNF